MFFLFGTRTKKTPIAQVDRVCSKCAKHTMHAVVETRRWFTLFFIPVIPLGGNNFTHCGVCGLTTKCPPELKNQAMTMKMAAKA